MAQLAPEVNTSARRLSWHEEAILNEVAELHEVPAKLLLTAAGAMEGSVAWEQVSGWIVGFTRRQFKGFVEEFILMNSVVFS